MEDYANLVTCQDRIPENVPALFPDCQELCLKGPQGSTC